MGSHSSDAELIEAARDVIRRKYRYDHHAVGAAMRLTSGAIVTAVHVEAYVGRVTVCAEAIAVGKVISDHDAAIEAVVAVRHPDPDEEDRTIRVVAPCGMCRELLTDYAPDAMVILPKGDGFSKVPVMELLPSKYRRE